MKDNKTECPLIKSAQLIGDPAVLLIVKSLSNGEKRYKDIKEYVSIVCDATLSTRLKKLTAQGLIKRTHHDEMPPKVTYKLTKTASPLLAVVNSLEEFGSIFFKK